MGHRSHEVGCISSGKREGEERRSGAGCNPYTRHFDRIFYLLIFFFFSKKRVEIHSPRSARARVRVLALSALLVDFFKPGPHRRNSGGA